MADDIHFQTIGEVAAKLRSGAITSSGLTELMLDRIERHNPGLNAFITVTPDLARDAARQADEELAAGRDRGPLHGIPVILKSPLMRDTAPHWREIENLARDTDCANQFDLHITAQNDGGTNPLAPSGVRSMI